MHEATYRDGRLYLSGRLPTKASRDAFVDKAAEVIGEDNVIDGYVIDPGAPEPGPGRVRVDEDLVFAPGSAVLSPDYSQILDLGIAVMRLNPEVQMVITGHTDDNGSASANQRLSEQRAQAVVDYLTTEGDLNPSRFTATGKGESSPRVPNDTEANQRLNRRIEVDLLGLV